MGCTTHTDKYTHNVLPIPKIKSVLNKTPEFPFWDLHICVDFDLRDSKKIENLNKLKKMMFHYKKNIDFHKTAKPHS